MMTALYIPCVATIAAIKQEAGTKWALLATAYTILLGWAVSTTFYQVAQIFVR
jgi:ferrous iron transport protein B